MLHYVLMINSFKEKSKYDIETKFIIRLLNRIK